MVNKSKKRELVKNKDESILLDFKSISIILFFTIILFILINSDVLEAEYLESQGWKIEENLLSNEVGRGTNSRIDPNQIKQIDSLKLRDLAKMDYDELKKELGIGSDFCIFFIDENGKHVNLSNYSGKSQLGIGSPEFNIEGVPCGKTL